jgi:hypothetical protein
MAVPLVEQAQEAGLMLYVSLDLVVKKVQALVEWRVAQQAVIPVTLPVTGTLEIVGWQWTSQLPIQAQV